MLKQNLVLAFLACSVLLLTVFSCGKDTEQLSDDSDIVFFDNVEIENPAHKGFEIGPKPKNGYCVGVIERIAYVKPGEEDTYFLGATICVECSPRQVDCRDSYWTRISRGSERIASVYVVSEESLCTECPRDGIMVE